MVKLEWYHYIILSPILVIDAVKKGYHSFENQIDNFREFQSLPELHKAVIQSDLDQVKRIVSSGANLETKDKNGETALFYALDKNRINIARFLIQKKANVNVFNLHGRHIVHPAIKNNQYDLIKLMLDYGLNPNFDGSGPTTLTLTANVNPNNFKCVRLFVEQGVNINALDKNHYSALMYLTMIENPNLEIVSYMISKKADVNAKDSSGRSILRLLIEKRSQNLALVKLLLKKGADIHSKDKEGQSIFDFINQYYDDPNTNEIVQYLKNYKKSSR
ncbi:ankyrin repeat domain-containing protein [Leptospira limi]|uniref:Ankyrin repeat domain-containing protein n=1 Tax=Leptospira limi TaxID=2950023 RepID=A0ABT3M176_9LEPT|nr:ankyrin repeat domain-containing protein [Leptospira limi]MCW7463709.1 ankyrin repeat domain-containing protein [Leptospira limi]